MKRIKLQRISFIGALQITIAQNACLITNALYRLTSTLNAGAKFVPDKKLSSTFLRHISHKRLNYFDPTKAAISLT